MGEPKNIGHLYKVHVHDIFEEIVSNNDTMWPMRQPLNILLKILAAVAKRCTEVNDPKLNAYMMRLALYAVADPNDPNYDADFVNEYIEKHLGL